MSMSSSVRATSAPVLLPNQEHEARLLPKQEHEPEVAPDQADAVASLLFDHALSDARLTSGEAAYLLGVSESMVRKMRSPQSRESVSLPKLLLLPIDFWICFIPLVVRRLNLGQRIIGGLMNHLSVLSLVVGR